MEFLIPVVKIIHIVVSLLLVLIILLQPSKSGDIGSMFGGGTSESVFGSSGAVPFLVKMTRLLGVIFVVTSLSLGYFSVRSIKGSVVKDPPAVEQPASEEAALETPSEEPAEEKSPEPEPRRKRAGARRENRLDVSRGPVFRGDRPGRKTGRARRRSGKTVKSPARRGFYSEKYRVM